MLFARVALKVSLGVSWASNQGRVVSPVLLVWLELKSMMSPFQSEGASVMFVGAWMVWLELHLIGMSTDLRRVTPASGSSMLEQY